MTLRTLQPSKQNTSFVGPIYILPSEDGEKAQRFLDGSVHFFEPCNVVVEDLVHQYVHNGLLVRRYEVHSSMIVERIVQMGHDAQVRRANEHKRRQEARRDDLARRASDRPEDVALLLALERRVQAAAEEVDAAIAERPGEFAYCRAMEMCEENLERLDRLIASATKRRDEAFDRLVMLAHAGFGQRLRETTGSPKIIEGTANGGEDGEEVLPTVAAPPVSPTA